MTSSNGLPVAITARPPVHARRSEGVASAREVGLDSGMITGRGTAPAIARTAASVNAPGWPETPIKIVGRAFVMTSSSAIG